MPTTKQLNAATSVVATASLIPVRGHIQALAVTHTHTHTYIYIYQCVCVCR